jgi:hypothetical protein
MNKYKPGDLVLVKPLSWFKDNLQQGSYYKVKEQYFSREMTKYCGKVIVIDKYCDGFLKYQYQYHLKDSNNVWSDWMFVGKVNKFKKLIEKL